MELELRGILSVDLWVIRFRLSSGAVEVPGQALALFCTCTTVL